MPCGAYRSIEDGAKVAVVPAIYILAPVTMSFDTNARRQAKELFDALMDRLVKDLSTAAHEETEAAVAVVRKDKEAAVAAAEKEADKTVAATRKEAEASIAAARKDAEATIASVRKQAEAAASAARKEAEGAAAAARKEAEAAARADAEATFAKSRLEIEKAAESQLAAARAEGEARLAAAQAMNAGLMEGVEGARQEVKTFEARVQHLEQERTEILRSRDEVRAALEAEAGRTHELAESLENAVQEANLAKQASSLARVEADARRQDRELALDRIGAALRSIDRAAGPSEILIALLEPLAHDFAKAAMFLVGAAGLTGWRARGLAATSDITKLVIPRAGDSLPARAVATRARVQVTANGGESPIGLWGSPVAGAVALPILAGDRVIAVVYAEDTEETSSHNIGRKISEMLIKHAALRLTMKGKASQPPATGAAATGNMAPTGNIAPMGNTTPMGDGGREPVYSPARQARRLKMREGIEVTLDGSTSVLVDMSSIGAQVVSPLALRPNRVVKMALRGDESKLSCKVRVMWARFEQPQGTAAAQYRVGVKFTDLEASAIDEFMARHGLEEPNASLQDSA
jgi:PilZ domain-containing protein